MNELTVRQHMASIAPLGGKALVKKHGRKHMSNIQKKRWATERARKKETT